MLNLVTQLYNRVVFFFNDRKWEGFHGLLPPGMKGTFFYPSKYEVVLPMR